MDRPAPPKAPARPVAYRLHDDERVDEYAWLRDRHDPAVIAHLEAENAYTDACMASTATLRAKLYDEIAGRIQQTDRSVPARRGRYWYFTRTTEGLQYPVYCRAEADPDGPEVVLLDQNALAEHHAYLALGAFEVSPDDNLLAYALDVDGSENFELRVRDLVTETDLPDVLSPVYYGVAWAADSRTVFYTTTDAAMRPFRVHRHALGSPAGDDVLVYQEDDERFFLNLSSTKSKAFVLVTLESHTTTEVRAVPTGEPRSTPVLVRERVHGVEYRVDHLGERFLIVTNEDAPDFKLVEAPVTSPGRWTDVVPHRRGVRLEGIEVFAGHVVIEERAQARRRLRVRSIDDGTERVVEVPEEVSTTEVGTNFEVGSSTLRFNYASLVTPASVFDEDLETGERVLRKQEVVLGGHDPEAYSSVRAWAEAPDGVRVPISVVGRSDLPRDGSNPCLLYGYGAYEHSIDPAFSSLRLSLLERGVVFAIAHVRGGGELGRRWYEDGKLLHKGNSFSDFVACARLLIADGWTTPDRLVARGRSAGGLLMGAVTNLAPDLFRAVVAEVPFVDVLTTMLDETIPLTVPEWEEWGNPKDPEYYRYMRSYSPYDNVERTAYPAMLVTGGINDPRVAFWEPAKWVARLRDRRTNDEPLLLQMEMGAGHMGPTGRYEAWRQEAFVLSFILHVLGLDS